MRLIRFIINDFKFYNRYGFIALYIIISLMYIAIINFLPSSWRIAATVVVVFSDPSALGFFFMGAIILYEKSEKVIDSISISPMTIDEYIISKVVALSLISCLSGLFIFMLSGTAFNIIMVTVSILLSSILFSLLGIIIASNISSLNKFIMLSAPMQIIIFVPALIYYFGINSRLLLLIPSVIGIHLISSNRESAILLTLLFVLWIVLVYFIARKCVKNMFIQLGGVKL